MNEPAFFLLFQPELTPNVSKTVGKHPDKKKMPCKSGDYKAFCDPTGIRTQIKGTGILHSIH